MNINYIDVKKTVTTVLDYNYEMAPSEISFNITYGVDENFLFGCGVSVASILLSNPHENITFHIFTDCFCDSDKKKFEGLAKQYKSHIKVYLIDCEKLKSFPSTQNWSYATYFRFIIADYFSGKLEKILYLDADIICKGNIKELTTWSFEEGEIAAVVVENDEVWWKNRSDRLSIEKLSHGYFNAGFLLIDIPQWAAEKISDRAIEMLGDPQVCNIITHLDQDVLNMILAGHVRFINKKYNTRISLNYQLKKNFESPITEDTVFIHFIGPTKPWHNWATYPASDSFLKAKKASPWSSSDLLKPGSSNQYRYSAKHHLNQGLIWHGLKNYLCYYKMKVLGKNK